MAEQTGAVALPRFQGKAKSPDRVLKLHTKQAATAALKASGIPTELTVRIGTQEFKAEVTVNSDTGRILYHFGGKGEVAGEAVNVGGNIMSPWTCPGFDAMKAKYLGGDSEADLDAGESLT